jgi:oligoribonuclease NrnB/cAMP/cGMP phosphodiesterase (DHH superfamily)
MKIVIYHAHCDDGFGGAWVAHRDFGDAATYHPASYGDAPPDVSGMDVLIVDFSYPRDVMIAMHSQANSMVVLDHHKTAKADCEGLDFCTFDMERSGARMAWDHFNPSVIPPALIRYIEDRDMWRFELEDSKEITAWIRSHPHDFDTWDTLADFFIDDAVYAVGEGRAILRSQSKQIASLCKGARRANIGGHDVPVLCSALYQSEIGHIIAEGEPFAAVWFYHSDGGRVWSLRSSAIGIDVSEIAKLYGGGGHKHAAGFRTP